MSIEGQPNTILTVYSPFAWVQEITATNTGTFITFPTAQNGPITFPNTITANKVESSFITTVDNAPLSIGTFVGRTRAINIGTGMSASTISLGGVATTTKLNILSSDSTLAIQNSDGLGIGAVSIGVGETRTGTINIGSNTTNTVGLSTGNVNIMCGTGIQEGSFNVLTNANNDGLINLGNVTTGTGGINLYGELRRGIQLGYLPTTYSGFDTYVGGYKQGTYQNLTAMSLDNAEQRIVGSISTLMSVGLYQVNVITTMTVNRIRPQLTFGIYTKTGIPAWVNGALRSTTGTLINSLNTTNHYYTTGITNKFSSSLSGLLVVSPKVFVAFVVGNADANTLNIDTVDSTYISLLRVG
jgi:hypothetical protein